MILLNNISDLVTLNCLKIDQELGDCLTIYCSVTNYLLIVIERLEFHTL